jgi:hypothetical protein
MKKAARHDSARPLQTTAGFPGSAAAYTIDEQRKGCVLAQRKKKAATEVHGGRGAGSRKRHNRVEQPGKRRFGHETEQKDTTP